MLRKYSIALLFLAVLAAAILGYHTYEKTAARRGSLALEHFATLAQAVHAEARYKFVDISRGGVQDTVLAGSSAGHSLAKADLSYRWDLAPDDLTATNVDMKAIAEAIKARLSSVVEARGLTMRYYYPNLLMAVDATLGDSDFYQKKAVRVSFTCSN
jgi:hypothetical protein